MDYERMNNVVCCMLCGCALTLLSVLGGCVERKLLIRSEPPGAHVVVNGQPAGITPATVPFKTYGEFGVLLSREGYLRKQTSVPTRPPWYEQIPVDFFAECLWPGTIEDIHDVTIELTPLATADDESVDRNEAVLRDRLAHPPVAP